MLRVNNILQQLGMGGESQHSEQLAATLVRSDSKQKNITIVGGGASSHVLAAVLGGIHNVSLMCLPHEVPKWKRNISAVFERDEKIVRTFQGKVVNLSSEAKEVVPSADYVILCMPVGAYRHALAAVVPYISQGKTVFIGPIYGQGGFNWMFNEAIQRDHPHAQTNNIVGFSFGLIPWICRIKEYGSVGVVYGGKEVNLIAMTHPQLFGKINEEVLKHISELPFGMGGFEVCGNFLSLSLSVDNQIIHPARCYGLYTKCQGVWKNKEAIPYFYREFDDFSAQVMMGLDSDYSKIRSAIKAVFPSMSFPLMMTYLEQERYSYKSETHDVKGSFRDSVVLSQIKPPTVQLPDGQFCLDKSHRFFHDDIHYGLCIAKWFAQELELKVDTIDMIIEWAQKVRGENLIRDHRLVENGELRKEPFYSGIPSRYGFTDIAQTVG